MGCTGIPASAILSIRAGATRRQAKLSDVDRPFRFPHVPGNDAFKVDLFTQIASGRAICPEDGDFQLLLEPTDGIAGGDKAQMELQFKLSRPQQDASATGGGGASLKKEVYRDAEEYLEQQNMLSFLQCIVQGLIKEKPTDAYSFVAKQFVAYKGDQDPQAKTGGRGEEATEVQALKQELEALKATLLAKDEELRAKTAECQRLLQANETLQLAGQLEAAPIQFKDSSPQLSVAPEEGEVNEVRELAREALTKGAHTGELQRALTLVKIEDSLEEVDEGLESLRKLTQDAFSRGALNGRLEEALLRIRGKTPPLGASSQSEKHPVAEGLLADLQQLGSELDEDDSVKAMAEDHHRLVKELEAMRTRIESVRPETEALRAKWNEMQGPAVETA